MAEIGRKLLYSVLDTGFFAATSVNDFRKSFYIASRGYHFLQTPAGRDIRNERVGRIVWIAYRRIVNLSLILIHVTGICLPV
jgi:hypothetical protein